MAFLIIIVVCYLVAELVKKTRLRNEWLPLISGAVGVVLTVVVYYALPTLLPTQDLATAITNGFFYGLAATGSNQVFKQTLKYITSKYDIPLPLPETEDSSDEQ